MTKITKLTADQTARLTEFRDAYLAHGLSTAPSDRDRAAAAVALAYRAAGLEPPKIIVWLNSPLAGAYGAAMLAQVRAQVWDQVWAQVGAQVWDQVGAQVRDQVRAQVWAQVWDQVRAQVVDQVRAQVGAQVWDQVWAQVSRAAFGQHDASWVGFYAFFDRVLGLPGADKTRGLDEMAQAAGWWWPFENAVIITERPTQLHRDDRNRLHSETTAAIKYPDGFAVYAYHGTRMPADVYEKPGALNVQRIMSEENAEVRRAMIALYGRDKFLADAGAEVVHCLGEDYPVAGLRDARLLKLDIRREPYFAVDVRDSAMQPDGSRRRYMFRINPALYGGEAGRNVHAAVASIHRKPNDRSRLYWNDWRDYAPAVET